MRVCVFQLCTRVRLRLHHQTVCKRADILHSVNQSKSRGRPVSARKPFTDVHERCMGAHACLRVFFERARPANAVRLPIWRCYAPLLRQLSNGFNKLVVCCSVHVHALTHKAATNTYTYLGHG